MSTRARAVAAVRAIEAEGRLVTFSLVAEVAGLSRPTLYNNPDVRAYIEGRIAGQRSARRRIGVKLRSDARTIADLRKENAKLREKLNRT